MSLTSSPEELSGPASAEKPLEMPRPLSPFGPSSFGPATSEIQERSHAQQPGAIAATALAALSLLTASFFTDRESQKALETRAVAASTLPLSSHDPHPLTRESEQHSVLASHQMPGLDVARPVRPLILIGGGEFVPQVAQLFHQWSMPLKEKIVIIAWASNEPERNFVATEQVLHEVGAINTARMPSVEETLRDPEYALQLLDSAGGVFLTGGDQTRLADRLAQTGIGQEILRRIREDTLTLAGTSAGTAIASSIMIAGSGDAPLDQPGRIYTQLSSSFLTEGYGLVDFPIIIDQHFSQRNRQQRLIEAITHPHSSARWGIGVDEATAAVIIDHRLLLVMGSHSVSIFSGDGGAIGEQPYLTLREGEVFDMQNGARFETVNHPSIRDSSGHWRLLAQSDE